MIDENKILEIRHKADIVDVISDYVNVTQKGKNHLCVCPFHNDTNPSMVISKEKQIFNCFSCGSGGNVFKFVMMYENVTFPESIKIVGNKIGVDVNVSGAKTNERFSADFDLMDLSMKYYLNNINTKSGLVAKEYLKKRGIDDDVIKLFNIGLATNDKDNLLNFLNSQNKNIDNATNVGLISKNGIDVYDTFRNRIMIPITNPKGQVVGFTGRIFNNEDFAKYVNTKETHIFKKSQILFNYYNAKDEIRKLKKVVVVEGNMDAIKMVSKGIKNVVATMGTAFTNEQIDLIKKLNAEVILLFDSDNAGELATVKNGDILLSKGINPNVVRLSDAKDPDEYIEKFGVDALISNINNPSNYIDYKIKYLKNNKNLSNSEDLAVFVKEILNTIKSLDNLTKSIVIDKISKDYRIDINILKGEIEFNSNEIKPEWVGKANVLPKTSDKYSIIANAILYYIASDYKYLRIYKSDLNFFKEKEERLLASEIDYFYSKNSNSILADFLTYINKDENLLNRMNVISREYSEEELSHDRFIEYLNLMKKRLEKEEINELKFKIKNELDVDKKIKLIGKLTKIKKGCVENECN